MSKVKRALETVLANLNSSTRVKYILHRLHPCCILRNSRTDKHWNKALLRLLENPESITRRSRHMVLINGVEVWVENYPYAYGSPGHGSELPSRSTVVKLKLIVDALDEKLNEERWK